MRNRFGKLGFICLALVLALALCGIGYAHWGETLTIESTIATGEWDCGGTIGFWKNWDKHKTFMEEEIEGWLGSINATSKWLGPTTVEGMRGILWKKSGNDMQCKFLQQYLATRLNVESELLSLEATYNFNDPDNYLGLGGSGTLTEIVAAIESKYPANPDDPKAVWPEKGEYEIMKNICDALNNTGGIYPHLF